MRAPILLFLAYCITQAAAFGLYGCYERVMFWNAYQLDKASDKQKMAKSCHTDAGVQKAGLGQFENGRCNFRQFLYYISGTDDEKANIKRLSADVGKSSSVDIIANRLYEGNVKGAYNMRVMWEGKGMTLPYLFKVVGEFVGEDRNKNTAEWRLAVTARQRVAEGRSALRDRSVGNYLRYKYDPDHQSWDPSREDVRDAPLVTEGKFPEKMSESANSKNGQGWPTVDLMEASKKIKKELKVKTFKIEDWYDKADGVERKSGETDEAYDARQKTGHRANVNAIKDAKASMVECVR